MMQHVRADVRIGVDTNKYLIALWDALLSGWCPPNRITEEQYAFYKANQEHDLKMTAFVGFGCSFGGKFFGGYARAGAECVQDFKIKNFARIARASLLDARASLKGVAFYCTDYKEAETLCGKRKATVYCDPPYAKTTKYATGFDSVEFWAWADKMAMHGHRVFVSEYSAPDHWKCVFSFNPKNDNCLKHERQREKLFVRADVNFKPVGFGVAKY